MTFMVITTSGHLDHRPRLSLLAKRNPDRLITVPDVPGQVRVWLPDQNPPMYTPRTNLIGTCMLVAYNLERKPYTGDIMFIGWADGKVAPLPAFAVAALTDLHTAIRGALAGVASGMGPEFDQQVIGTAKMAWEAQQ